MKIGDRVWLNLFLIEDKEFNNQSGIIIQYDFYIIGIEFDEYIGGHNCQGRGKNGHCWYVNANYVIIEDNIATFKEELDKITL